MKKTLKAASKAARPRRKSPTKGDEARREAQRAACVRLLERWLPLATAEALAIEKESRGGPVVEEEAYDAGLKAGAFVLKVLERLARLDGLDGPDRKGDPAAPPVADPLELARRVRAVSPILIRRLEEARQRESRSLLENGGREG